MSKNKLTTKQRGTLRRTTKNCVLIMEVSNLRKALILVLVLLAFTIQVYANSPTFSAYPILPENQISEKGYFDIEMRQNQEQDLMVGIENYTAEDINIKIEAVTATTASNGEVNLYKQGISDVSMLYPFDSLVHPRVSFVTIPAKSMLEVPIRVVAPKKTYDGIILGGLCIIDAAEPKPDAQGFINKYPSVIPVRITENPQRHIEPDFDITDIGLSAEKQSTVFSCMVRNPMPELFKPTKVIIQLLHKADEVLAEEREIEFAPNSVFEYSAEIDSELKAGEYTAHFKIIYEETEYVFEQNFKVGTTGEVTMTPKPSAQKRGLAQGARDIAKIPWLIIILLVLGGVLFVVYRRRKKVHNASKET